MSCLLRQYLKPRAMTKNEMERIARMMAEILAKNGLISDEVIDVDEVAQILGVSKSYVFHHIDEIPHSKPYKKLRFFKSDIVKMLRR